MPVSRSARSTALKLQVAPVYFHFTIFLLYMCIIVFIFKKKGFDFLKLNLEHSCSLF